MKKICISVGIVLIILIIAGIIMGSWFMKYESSQIRYCTEIEYGVQTMVITDIKDIEAIENILVNSKYNGEICDGINTHKITMNDEVYYLKESCKRNTKKELNKQKSRKKI